MGGSPVSGRVCAIAELKAKFCYRIIIFIVIRIDLKFMFVLLSTGETQVFSAPDLTIQRLRFGTSEICNRE